eukprot:CAMPEP_0119086080 /NCGR_PEP_ID=MMETSP1178-20130426/136416_1 /TAXON_ID=33656 /ORGANISM="unid sp, Strain CCMP2000" /LENGTH=45 /DNA_ID= /DNA_START= /DNA_END= /DNA_ORIENTATION=
MRELDLAHNLLTGSLEPLRGCTRLNGVDITYNQLEGGLEPLQDCP